MTPTVFSESKFPDVLFSIAFIAQGSNTLNGIPKLFS